MLGAAPARAADDDPNCTATTYGSEPARAAPLRMGIDPELAGSVGTGQSAAVPLDEAKDIAALHAFTPPGKAMVLRVNRLFWADGEAGIRRFQEIVARHDAAGFDSELQVRYHPAEGDEGDIEKWTAYVRHVVDVFGPDPHVVAMTITNEVNLNISENTSDGAYAGAVDALIEGIKAARAEADRIGRPDLPFGFTFAFRWNPGSDAKLWNTLGTQGGDAFRRALGFVGIDDYPGTFWPPVIAPTSSPGNELVIALATLRRCYMPKAGLGDDVPIWITENGFESGPERDDAAQAAALEDMVRSAAGVAGTYNVTDYRWFNLRDNRTGSPGIFDTTGLLRDDYSEKPAFPRFRALVSEHGAAAHAASTTPCSSRRKVRITLPRGARNVRVTIGGGRSARVGGRGRRLTIDFTGFPSGSWRVVVRGTAHGKRFKLSRRYRTCAPGRSTTGSPRGSA